MDLSQPAVRSALIMPVRSNTPSPQYRRRWTVSSNNVPTTCESASLSSTPMMRCSGTDARSATGRVSALDMPRVDDDARSVVSGVLDELQSVVQRLDVRPGEELDSQPRADACAWAASSANFAAQCSRSHGASSPSGVTLMCLAPSASAALSRSCRIRSDSSRRGPSSHQYGIPSSSRSTMPLSSSMARIPLSPYSCSAAGRSADSSPKPRNPAADAASIRSRRVQRAAQVRAIRGGVTRTAPARGQQAILIHGPG